MDNLKRNADTDPEHDEIQKVKRQRLEEKISKTDEIDLGNKREQVIALIKREFQNEITKRQDEVHLIQQRLLKAQKTLHLLKYVIIKSFYDKKELKIISGEESVINHSGTPRGIDSVSANAQSRIHPAIKKLLGKKPVETVSYDFTRTRGQAQNTCPTFANKELEQKTNESEEQNVTANVEQEITQPSTNSTETTVPIRNRLKIKHDIIVGNISKYIPSNNSKDNSTHKWMVYIRGPRDNPDISHFVKKVRIFLHPSYQPNDIVELEEPPFHLSRRGWGEFPVRIQIHFQNSSNKPIDVIHNLKLDQNRTGRQTLGNETLLTVWLHNSSLMVENELGSEAEDDRDIKQEINEDFNFEEESIDIKDEIEEPYDNCELESQDYFEPEPGCSKYNKYKEENIDIKEEPYDNCNLESQVTFEPEPGSSKYNKYNEGSIDIKGEPYDNCNLESQELYEPKPGCSTYNYYKPNAAQNNNSFVTPRNIKIENETIANIEFENNATPRDYYLIHLVDHCYTGEKIDESIKFNLCSEKGTVIDQEKYKFNIPVNNFSSIRQIVYFLFKKLPLVTKLANDLSYKCCYPYVASTLEEFCSWHYAKRCCSEWYRAKHIKNMLKDHKIADEEEWSIKFIIMFGRAHAFTPLANYEIFRDKSESGKTLPNQMTDSEVDSTLTEYIPITYLMENTEIKMNREEECVVDVESLSNDPIVKVEDKIRLKSSETDPDLLPLCNYIRKTASEIKINLEDEEIEPGIFHNSTERIILQSVTCLAEELIRTAWANKVIGRKGRNLECRLERRDVFKVLLEREEFDIFTNKHLGKAVT